MNETEKKFKLYYISKRGLKRTEFILSVFSRDDFKCVECGSFIDLECHHKSYKNVGTVKEKDDCITLCKKCHIKKK